MSLRETAAKVITQTLRRGAEAFASVVPGLPRKLLPPASGRRAAFDRLVRNAYATTEAIGDPPFGVEETPEPHLGCSAEPEVSIVVTSWNNVDHTLRCLASIGRDDPQTRYEVIVVDDASPEPGVRERLRSIRDIELVCLDDNVGYLRATNAGVAQARAPLVVLLNNDVQVGPGWLDALVGRYRSSPGAGAVGARLLYPDGRLQEAGSIVWRDGTGWNYGRGRCPSDSEYRFVREVDYCSAACLLVENPGSQPLFDERFAPAYYEDTDLCFRVWARGRRVLYEPRAIVFHHEGASHGTDIESGLKAHQGRNRLAFVDKWADALSHQLPAAGTAVAVARDRRREQRVLVVDEKIPTPDLDSGSVRMLALLDALADSGRPVHFIPGDRRYVERYSRRLEERGIEVLDSAASARRFFQTLASEVSLCIVSRPLIAAAYGKKLRRRCPRAALVYDMVDFHAVRDDRLQLLGSSAVAPRLRKRIARIEARAMAFADAVIAITPEEARAATQLVGAKPLVVIPNIHAPLPTGSRDRRDRDGLLFVGSFKHEPNVDAVDYIVRDLSPLFAEQLPGATIRIAGSDTPEDLHERVPSNVELLGWVPDLSEAYDDARVVIAPLRAGAGLKGKIGEAMAAGVPVVTTSIGAEGFGATSGEHLLVADDPRSFVEAVGRLWNDDALWRSVAQAASTLIAQDFSPKRAETAVSELFDVLAIGPLDHR